MIQAKWQWQFQYSILYGQENRMKYIEIVKLFMQSLRIFHFGCDEKKTKRSTQMNGWIYIGWEITNLFSFTGLEIETLFCFIWFSPNVHELYGNWCMYSIRSTSYHARNRNSSSLISRPEKYYARLFVWIQYFIVKLLCNYSSLFLWASQFTMNSSNNLLFGISDCSHWSWREAI